MGTLFGFPVKTRDICFYPVCDPLLFPISEGPPYPEYVPVIIGVGGDCDVKPDLNPYCNGYVNPGRTYR